MNASDVDNVDTEGAEAAAPFPPRVRRVAGVVFVGYGVVWVGVLGYTWTTFPDLHHGDWYSDANVLNAGRNFDQFGIGLNYGLPTWTATHSPSRPAPPYTHYPPGPEWIHQGLKAVGLHELWHFRAASVAIAGLALLLLMTFVSQLTGSRVVAALAVFFYSWSAPFSQYADSLHQFAYAQLTLFACLAAWLAFERARTPGHRRFWLTLAALAFFCDLWLTFEHVAFIPVFVGARMLSVGRRRDLAGAAVLAVVLLGALSLRVAHNSLALGSVSAAVDDLLGAAKYRAAYEDQAFSFASMLQTWQVRLGGADVLPDHFEYEFAYPVLKVVVWLPALLLAVVLLGRWRRAGLRPLRRGLAGSLLLLAAGLAWFVAMRNHALNHRHVVMHILPGACLLLASLTACGLASWWSTPRRALLRWAGPLLALVLVLGFGAQMRTSLTLNQLETLDPFVRREVRTRRGNTEIMHRAAAGPLRRARRVLFGGGLYGKLAYATGRPHESLGEQLPEQIAADDVVWIEFWSDREKELAWRAFERWGLPDMLSPPMSLSLIFWGRPAGTPLTPQRGVKGTETGRYIGRIAHQEVNIRFETGIRMTELRCVPTLDEGAWLVQTRFELPPQQQHTPEKLIEYVYILADDGRVTSNADARFSKRMCHGNQVVVWHLIPKRDLPRSARLRIGLWSQSERRCLEPMPADSVLPSNATWDVEHRAFVLGPLPS